VEQFHNVGFRYSFVTGATYVTTRGADKEAQS
jgi:hypothetical protein